MDYSGASAYTYAKMSAMLGRLFVGERALQLFDTKSLSELWSLVFESPVPQLPESLLANKIEAEATSDFIKQYSKILDNFSSPDPFLFSLLKRYDVENLKVISAALSLGETDIPNINQSAPSDLSNVTVYSVPSIGLPVKVSVTSTLLA